MEWKIQKQQQLKKVIPRSAWPLIVLDNNWVWLSDVIRAPSLCQRECESRVWLSKWGHLYTSWDRHYKTFLYSRFFLQMGQHRPLFCLFSVFSTTIFTEKLSTSAGFELGLLTQEASTLTTWPPPRPFCIQDLDGWLESWVPWSPRAKFEGNLSLSTLRNLPGSRLLRFISTQWQKFRCLVCTSQFCA